MFLEEVIIEGFKSYATRTVISGWDSQFNAITGLNGSGKSNILDAICFVLGLENLRQVRAGSIQDLVYKRGQTGINKASVSIVFNNSDSLRSPAGYSDSKKIIVTRQIVLNGKVKYLINGHAATQKAIEDLFHSVQLNVNNPHFLVMQGQITKILNMRSEEVLSMLEEASGTRMYEERKERALSSLEKKGAKLDSINRILSQVINPRLEKLRKDRSSFFEYQKIESQVIQLKDQLQGHNYASLSKDLSDFLERKQVLEADFLTKSNACDDLQTQIATQQEQLSKFFQIKHLEFDSNDSFRSLAGSTRSLEDQIVRMKAEASHSKTFLEESAQELRALTQSLDSIQVQQRSLLEEERTASQELRDLRIKAEQLQQRISLNEKSHCGGTEMKEKLRATIATLQEANKQAKDKIQSLQLSFTSGTWNKAEIEKEQHILEEKIQSLRSDCSLVSDQEDSAARLSLRATALTDRKALLKSTLANLEGEQRLLLAANTGCVFEYDNPTPSFNRSLVLGPLISLVSAKDPKFSLALETVAGGRLFNVVVADEKVASQLLEHGGLRKRMTFIPLTKINSHPIPKSKLDAAKAQFPQASLLEVAISLVDFDAHAKPAVEYAFASTIVCDDLTIASKIAFDFGCRTVTLDGDLYDPSGTLTGGSIVRKQNPQSDVFRLRLLNLELRDAHEQHRSCIAELDSIQKEGALLAMKSAEQSQRLQEVKFFEEKFSELRVRFQDSSEKSSELERELSAVARREDEIKKLVAAQSASNLSGLLETDQKELTTLSRQISATNKSLHSIQVHIANSKQESEEIACRLAQVQQEQAESSTNLVNFSREIFENEAKLGHQQTAYKAALQKFSFCESEISHCTRELEVLKRSLKSAEIAARSLQSEVMNSRGIEAGMKAKLAAIPVPSNRLVLQPLPKIEVSRIKSQLASLEDKFRNSCYDDRQKAVLEQIESMSSKEKKLIEMLETVSRDKEKIAGTIEKLSKAKKMSLKKTIDSVGADFEQIFGRLFPGGAARLLKIASEAEHEVFGVDIQVSLDAGKTWKASLTELSGGQRSLAALSLIMAMLKHRPAPMYILDEVDAALDLAHTQGIGTLLRQGMFCDSQFIVVSLKEGMFSNANVLFRTSVKDGQSSVERLALKE